MGTDSSGKPTLIPVHSNPAYIPEVASRLDDDLSDKDFAQAVQWHPEMMYDNMLQAKIFMGLVRTSSEES